jgi:hypothetical protein
MMQRSAGPALLNRLLYGRCHIRIALPYKIPNFGVMRRHVSRGIT